MINYEQEIRKSFQRIINCAENILLRPNDTKLLFGEEKYNNMKLALEKVLEDYKQTDIYNYYYELPKVKHGFCTFKRWQLGLLH
jgi:hypothetical protein